MRTTEGVGTFNVHPLRPASRIACLLAAFAATGGLLDAQQSRIEGPILYEPIAPRVFEGDLSRLPKTRAWRPGDPVREVEDLKRMEYPAGRKPGTQSPSFLGLPAGPGPGIAATASPVSFDGIPATGWAPPDTVGDVGPNHYIQTVNISLAIYDKGGNLLVGPSPINALWAGFGGPCENSNNGDPIVRYDQLADR